MTKLEGFSKVAVIKWGYCTQYHFAIYDDGNDYRVGDMVALSDNNPNAKIDEIITYTLPLDEVFERNLIIISKQP